MVLAYLFVIALLVSLDQFSKEIILTYINKGEIKVVIPDFFNITNVENSGAAWSMFNNQQTLLIIVSVFVIIYISYLLFNKKYSNKLELVSFLLIIGGALGNLIDRIFRKSVVDFLDFYIFKYDFPVFNLADIFLTIGVFLLIVSYIVQSKHEKN